MNNYSGFAGDDLLVLNTSSLQLWVSSCCTLLAVSELQFRWDAIELHSSVLILRIKRLCDFAGDDVQVSLVHVRGAGLHFSRNSSISGWFNRARQQSRWIFITIKRTSKIGDNSASIHGPFHRNLVTRIPGRTTTLTIDWIIHMQAEPEAVDNISWTGDDTTIVSNQQSMLAVWDMAAWSRTIIAVIALIGR